MIMDDYGWFNFQATDVQKALTLASQQIQFFANGNPQKDSDKLIYR